eukprot:3638896-Amphidinium_carterae.1
MPLAAYHCTWKLVVRDESETLLGDNARIAKSQIFENLTLMVIFINACLGFFQLLLKIWMWIDTDFNDAERMQLSSLPSIWSCHPWSSLSLSRAKEHRQHGRFVELGRVPVDATIVANMKRVKTCSALVKMVLFIAFPPCCKHQGHALGSRPYLPGQLLEHIMLATKGNEA